MRARRPIGRLVSHHMDRAADHKAGLIDAVIRRLGRVTLHAGGIAVTVDAMNSSDTPECVKNQPLAWRAVKPSEPAQRPFFESIRYDQLHAQQNRSIECGDVLG